MASKRFNAYEENLQRHLKAEMIDWQLVLNEPRRLSVISAPAKPFDAANAMREALAIRPRITLHRKST